MVSLRILGLVVLAAASLSGVPPEEWVPVRWDGGPLELIRRQKQAQESEQKQGDKKESYTLTETQEQAIRDWYQPSTLSLLQGVPYNCVLLTWNLGQPTEFDASQREQAAAYAARLHEQGLVVLAVIGFGPESLAAVEAAAGHFDGAVLEGAFSQEAAEQAHELLRKKNPDAVVVPMDSWKSVKRDARFPILASNEGVWPGMLSPDEAEGWGAGPTSNPWVLSNAWQIGVLRADRSDRPVWMGHRPKKHRPQPLELKDYIRAVADSAMAGARWVVAVGDDWRTRLFAGDDEAIEQWNELAEWVRFFEEKKEWKKFELWPSAVVVHDPKNQSSFDTFDVLNMLGVRHIPHLVILREDFSPGTIPSETEVLAFDFVPGNDPEHETLQSFTEGGGTLLTGPRWAMAKFRAGDEFKKLIAGAGSIRGYPSEEVDSDRLSRDVREIVEHEHAAPNLYNVGSIISVYRVDTESDRALLQMTEYGDYPTEFITVKLPRPVAKARMYTHGEAPVDLEIYEGDEGGSEIDVPKVPSYCAVIIEYQRGQNHAE